ncbi:MAG: prepilin-type N-terminal cleavage/methylation domain-containing protein [Thermodesulfobacteriota bacterium]
MIKYKSFEINIRSNDGGYTLLEILIALAIATLVVSITYASFSAITSRTQATERSSRVHYAAGIIMDRLFLDLTCAYMRSSELEKDPDVFFQFQEGPSGTDSWQRFSFTSTAHLPLSPDDPGGDLGQISYELLKSDTEGEGYLLYRTDEPLFAETTTRKSAPLLLSQDLIKFSVEFFDRDENPFKAWDSTQGAQLGRLPTRITIAFAIKGEDGLEYPFMTGYTLPLGQ